MLVNPLNKQMGLMGEMMHGGLAEKCLVAEHQLIRMPDKVRFEEAAALPVAYGTAHRMIITHHSVKQGQSARARRKRRGVGTAACCSPNAQRGSHRVREQRGPEPAPEGSRC